MTTTLRAREPRDLLALIPHQLGFVPERSVVAVSLRPPRARVGLTARVDLVDVVDAGTGAQICRTLVSYLASDGATAAVLVLYVPEAVTERLPDDLLRAVLRFEEACGPHLDLREVWVVDPEAYASVHPDGYVGDAAPVAELADSAVAAHLVYSGSAVVADRAALAEPAPAPAARRGAASRAARRGREAREAAVAEGGEVGLLRWRTEQVRTWRCLVAAEPGTPATPTVLGGLCAGLDDIVVRDAVLLSLVSDVGDLPETSLLGSGAEGTEDRTGWALACIVDPVVGVAPSPELVHPARRVLSDVVAHRPDRPAAPTLLALLAWWEGSGAAADAWLVRAARSEPGYRLAGLLRQAVDAGMPPGWVRSRRAHE